MNRRRLVVLALGARLSGHAASLWAQAPIAGLRRVGVLAPSTRAREDLILKPFYDEMHRLGWIEGRHIAYDAVYADDRHHDLPRLATELVARKPELIFAPRRGALAVKQAACMTLDTALGSIFVVSTAIETPWLPGQTVWLSLAGHGLSVVAA